MVPANKHKTHNKELMTQIHFEPHREGMTVLPETVDQATGEKIEGTAQIVDTRFANLVEEETETESYVEVDDDALDPEDRDPSMEVRLADTFEEINTSEFQVDPGMANSIAQVDLGSSPEAITVQHLAASVYNGNITPEEAFHAGVESGINPDKLMFQYYKLKSYFE